MSVDFEPVDVTQDLDLSDVVRTNIEGTSAVDYDVEYGVLPVNAEQLAAPTHNVGVPAEGTLGYYETDGEGDSEKYEVETVTLKAAGHGYVKDAIARIKGISPSDVEATVKIDAVSDPYYELPSVTLGVGGSGFVVGETITLNSMGAAGDTKPVVTVTAVKEGEGYYTIDEIMLSDIHLMEIPQQTLTSATITIIGSQGYYSNDPATFTCTLSVMDPNIPQVYTVDNIQKVDGGKFTEDPKNWEHVDWNIEVEPGPIQVDTSQQNLDINETHQVTISGVIDTISLTNKGHFASSTYAGTYGGLSGSISGTGASISVPVSVEVSDGEITSVSLVSGGEYCKELDGDVDVIAGSGTGGKVTVDMEKIEPEEESGEEESGLEE